MDMHGALASELLEKDKPNIAGLIEDVKESQFQKLDPKLRSLAEIARVVAATPRQLTQAHLDAASKAGASDTDVVLAITIASADAVYSRRIESMRSPAAAKISSYAETTRDIVQHGYKKATEMAVSNPIVVRVKGTS
jgi:alkylhydroperoxidase/carboxymuconolactone decarboxylase family protein YurZ